MGNNRSYIYVILIIYPGLICMHHAWNSNVIIILIKFLIVTIIN